MDKPTITRREWRNVVLFALLVLLLTSLPYLVGVFSQRSDLRFGGFLFGVEDGNSYLAKMREGAVDGWLFHIVYTSEPHDGAVLFTPYLAAGKLTAAFVPPSSPGFVNAMLIMFHASRVLFGLLLILLIYRFTAAFISRPALRGLALLLICLGGGFGWLLLLAGQSNWLGSSPVDFILPEGYSFYLFYGLPHLELARAALLGGLLLTFHALTLPGLRHWLPWSLGAGLCWLVMGLCVPFYITVLYVILGVWGIAALLRTRRFPWQLFLRCVAGCVIPVPYLLYNLIVFATNPVLGAWSGQNQLASPNPLHYVVGYGLLAALAIPALRWAWRRGQHHPAYLLLPAWVLAAPVLAYLPINVQRRLLEGVFVPLCILAVIGFQFLWTGIRARWHLRRPRLIQREAAIVLVLLLIPSNLLILATGAAAAAHPATGSILFHSDSEIAALDWLNAHAVPDSIVLSTLDIGNYLPARTSLRAYIGHSPETIRLEDKLPLVERFLAGTMSAADRRSLLDAGHIGYVIAQGSPLDMPELQEIYHNDDYFLYETKPAN